MITEKELVTKLKKLESITKVINDKTKERDNISEYILDECKRVLDIFSKCFKTPKVAYYYFTNADDGEIGTPSIIDDQIYIVALGLNARDDIRVDWITDGYDYTECFPVKFLCMESEKIKNILKTEIARDKKKHQEQYKKQESLLKKAKSKLTVEEQIALGIK